MYLIQWNQRFASVTQTLRPHVSESYRMASTSNQTNSPIVTLTHSLNLGVHFSRINFCDLLLTRDGVTTVAVHRNIVAAVSRKLQNLIDSKGDSGIVFVTEVSGKVLQKVVDFIYEGGIEFSNRQEAEDFMQALASLEIELETKEWKEESLDDEIEKKETVNTVNADAIKDIVNKTIPIGSAQIRVKTDLLEDKNTLKEKKTTIIERLQDLASRDSTLPFSGSPQFPGVCSMYLSYSCPYGTKGHGCQFQHQTIEDFNFTWDKRSMVTEEEVIAQLATFGRVLQTPTNDFCSRIDAREKLHITMEISGWQ